MNRDPRHAPPMPLPKRNLIAAVLMILALLMAAVSTIGAAFFYNFYSDVRRELPDAAAIKKVQLKLPSVVVSADDVVIGEIFTEKRYPLVIDDMGRLIQDAFVAAEDASFFEHSGVDYGGIIRAGLRYVTGSGPKQGGSTITQQLAKNLLLTREKTIARKLKDMLLAREIENIMSKDDILELYLNTIFLGNNSYGVEAAARNYFRVPAKELNLAQASMIAGLAPAPSAYAPTTNYKAAKVRQRYVLRQMVSLGKVSQEEAEAAYQEQLQVYRAESPNTTVAPYFMADVRKIVEGLIEPEALNSGGYRIYTTVNAKIQGQANQLVPEYLGQFEEHKGFKGPIARHGEAFQERLAEMLQGGAPDMEASMNAIVTDLAPGYDAALVITEAGPGLLLAEDHMWALKAGKNKESSVLDFAHILQIGDELKVRVKERRAPARIKENIGDFDSLAAFLDHYPNGPLHKGIRFYELVDVEQVEAAAILLDAATGDVKFMIGGSSFEQSQFNRATQALRQMGSSIKPLYYAYSFDHGFGLASKLDSPPIVIGDWKPENYSKDFLSRKTLRTSLIRSYNIPSIQLFQALGSAEVASFLDRLGLNAPRGDLSVALGSVGATVLRVAQSYTPFLTGGRLREARLVTRIEDREGKVLFDGSERSLLPSPLDVFTQEVADEPARDGDESGLVGEDSALFAEEKAVASEDSLRVSAHAELTGPQVLSPGAAYLGFAALRDVVRWGTGSKARISGLGVAGKTGTTNGYTDAWFVGMVPGYICAVWVGFDDARKSLGREGTGGNMAAPLWRQIMMNASEELELRPVSPPEGVEMVRMNPESGDPALSDSDGVQVPAMVGLEPGSSALRHALGLHGFEPPGEGEDESETRKRPEESGETSRNLRSFF